MVNRIGTVLVLSSLLSVTAARAQDATTGGVTTAPAEEVTRGLLPDETFSVKPEAGFIAYKDQLENNTGRAAVGLGLEWNMMPMFSAAKTQTYFGIGSGLIYSHMGGASSNLFGGNTQTDTPQGANMLIVPTDLKVGYDFTDHFRLAAHGGANLVYRSIASSTNIGAGSDSDSSLWKYYPNVGADFDFALGKGVALTIRPDWTLTQGNHLFTGTLGIGFFTG